MFTDPEIELTAAQRRDDASGPGGGTSHVALFALRELPNPQRTEAAKHQRPISDGAFAEFPPTKEFRAAADEYKEIQHEYRAHVQEIQTLRAGQIGGQYKAILDHTAKAPASEPEAFAAIEPESAFTARLEAEIRARTEALFELGRQSIKPTFALQREINRTLGLFVAKLEKDEADQARKFGIAYEASGTAKLAHSVRLLFCIRTWDWRRVAKDAEKGGQDRPFPWAKNVFSDYIDTSEW